MASEWKAPRAVEQLCLDAERKGFRRGKAEVSLVVEQDERGCVLPRLTARSVQRYIGAVAEAVALGELEPRQAASLLYAVQVLVSAQKAKVSK